MSSTGDFQDFTEAIEMDPNYSEYYNDATRQRIADLFADDIEAFGYEFEDRT